MEEKKNNEQLNVVWHALYMPFLDAFYVGMGFTFGVAVALFVLGVVALTLYKIITFVP